MSDELTRSNLESWREMVSYYEDFVRHTDWEWLQPLLRVVRKLAASHMAEKFRAGQSLWHLIISTAPKWGLDENEPFIAMTLIGKSPQLKIEYWEKTGGRVLEKHTCGEDDVMPFLQPVLDRLWEGTRGQRAS